MGEQEVNSLLEQLQQNVREWDQTTASLPALLQRNELIFTKMKAEDVELNKGQQTQLTTVIEQYRSLVQTTAQKKQAVLQEIHRLDQQKAVKGGPYQQKMVDGMMVQIDY